MNYLRPIICVLSALLVGCASISTRVDSPAVAPKYDFSASTVVKTENVYTAPAYVPTIAVPAQSAYVAPSPVTAYEPTVIAAPGYGAVAENGSYYGQPNANGVPKTVAVGGYYRKDGTYVRGHYRSAPGSNPPSTRRRK